MPTKNEALAKYVTDQSAINDQQDAAIDAVLADVKFLNDKITALQNTPDGWTPADQALLDALQQRTSTTLSKLQALDALTNPEPPPPAE